MFHNEGSFVLTKCAKPAVEPASSRLGDSKTELELLKMENKMLRKEVER